MNLSDVQNQTTWCRKVSLTVSSIGEPGEAPHGWCQAITVWDEQEEGIINYFYKTEEEAMSVAETTTMLFDVRWVKDKGYFQGFPSEAQDVQPQNVWERKDRRIAKMSCIKSAVEFYANAGVEYNINKVVDTANIFLEYIYSEEKP